MTVSVNGEGQRVIRFSDDGALSASDDINNAKNYFSSLLDWQAAVLDATIRALDSDPDNDILVFVEGLGPVTPGDPSTLRSITFQEDLYERSADVVTAMLQKTSQIIETTSRTAAGN